jgi:hypothetical protein
MPKISRNTVISTNLTLVCSGGGERAEGSDGEGCMRAALSRKGIAYGNSMAVLVLA